VNGAAAQYGSDAIAGGNQHGPLKNQTIKVSGFVVMAVQHYAKGDFLLEHPINRW